MTSPADREKGEKTTLIQPHNIFCPYRTSFHGTQKELHIYACTQNGWELPRLFQAIIMQTTMVKKGQILQTEMPVTIFLYYHTIPVKVHSRVSMHPPIFGLHVNTHAPCKPPLPFFSITAKNPPYFFYMSPPTIVLLLDLRKRLRANNYI